MKHRLERRDGKRLLLYTKTYAHARGESIHAVMRALWESAAGRTDALTCPEPLAWLPEASTLVLRALPGTAAIGALDTATLEDDMAQAGRGLARLHTSPVTGLEPWSAADELENLEKAARSLERYDADLGPVLARVLALARSGITALGPATVPVHGAFRFTQLLTYRDQLALVDFDGFKQGHPMCDVGSFVAHLWYLHAKHELDADTARAAARAFIDAYRSVAPWGAPEPALRWYTAVQLVAKHAQKCVKRLKDDGDSKIRHMLQLAERILDGDLPAA
jgi:aminoglycoside phosphotransferase (APT) family kinase protein